MKSIFILCLLIKQFFYILYIPREPERFYFIKCIFYLICTVIHSTFSHFFIPSGFCIAIIIYLFDHKNKNIKRSMIIMGLIIILATLVNYSVLVSPFKKAYLHAVTNHVNKLTIYSRTSSKEELLFSISDPLEITSYLELLKESTPVSEWHFRNLPEANTYLIKLSSENKTSSILLSAFNDKHCNLYIGPCHLTYQNTAFFSLISDKIAIQPKALVMNTSKNNPAILTHTTILRILWRTILWEDKENINLYNKITFPISTNLILEDGSLIPTYFSNSFNYAYIESRGIVYLPSHLSVMLKEQYILSKLDTVPAFKTFSTSSLVNSDIPSVHYTIKKDISGLYYGLYKQDYKTQDNVLLHTVNSIHSQYFILKNPYLLLLDEGGSCQYSLMLINQNIPDKHRYIEKKQNILPKSITFSPNKEQFTYIVNHNNLTQLYYISNYYHSAKIIGLEGILESKFLSSDYIVYTQNINSATFLCVYSIPQSKVIKYTYIPANIKLFKTDHSKLYFLIQKEYNTVLSEGLFSIDSSLTIKKEESYP